MARLPDVGAQLRVGIVTFNSVASLHSGFGSVASSESVQQALASIVHTGGTTSLVHGVREAVSVLGRAEHERPDARRLAVLISDGNSQDPWPDVLAAAQQLRTLNTSVYAATVSPDVFFR